MAKNATGLSRTSKPEIVDFCPKETLGYRMKRALNAWSRRFDSALRPLGLTHLQFVTLAAIREMRVEGGIPSQVRVAEWMHQDTMMLSKILRLLEDRGYVSRHPHPDDPRANALELTDSGLEVLARGVPLVIDAHEAFFGRLPNEERRVLTMSLDRLLEDES